MDAPGRIGQDHHHLRGLADHIQQKVLIIIPHKIDTLTIREEAQVPPLLPPHPGDLLCKGTGVPHQHIGEDISPCHSSHQLEELEGRVFDDTILLGSSDEIGGVDGGFYQVLGIDMEGAFGMRLEEVEEGRKSGDLFHMGNSHHDIHIIRAARGVTGWRDLIHIMAVFGGVHEIH